MSDASGNTEMIIEINSCNNIKNCKLQLKENELNIRFAQNGTGKSTIAKAIEAYVKDQDLSFLKPFGIDSVPEVISSKELKEVLVFNESFISNTVFKESEVIDNAFEVFVKSPDYDRRVASLNEKMKKLKIGVDENSDLGAFLNIINQISQKLKLNSNGISIKNDAVWKSLVSRENIYRVPSDLEIFKPFLQNKEVNIDWIDWKSKGENYDEICGCPFCAKKLPEDYKKQKESFKKSFQKASTKNLKEMLDLVESLEAYLGSEKYKLLIQCIKDDVDVTIITQELTKMRIELQGIVGKVAQLMLLNNLDIKREQIGQIADLLHTAKFNVEILDYFKSDLVLSIFKDLNIKIEEIESIAKQLKVEIGEFIGFVLSVITNAKRDINKFLQSSGIMYELEIEQINSTNVKTLLKYKKSDDSQVDVENINDHLSWGEKNAFSLILFMHYALCRNPDLIILDDPVSSFDDNKKYAIINRLFSKHYNGKSLLNRSVLLLSHDFEPVIDFIVNKKPTGGSVNAEYLCNKDGMIQSTKISSDDIDSWIKLLRKYSLNQTLCPVNRLAFLRKYIELTNHRVEMDYAYNIISSLQHGDMKPMIKISEDEKIDMNSEQYKLGKLYLDEYFENFNYDDMISVIRNEQYLRDEYQAHSSNYFKLQIFRTYIDLTGKRDQIKDESLVKYIDETYHIENDYIYYFDIEKYEVVPDFIIKSCDEFINS